PLLLAVAEEGAEEDARVQSLVADRAGVALLLLRPAELLDVFPDVVRTCSPALRVPLDPKVVREPAGAVEGDPAHSLRMREVLGVLAALPDARVLLSPDLTDEIRDLGVAPALVRRERAARARV